MLEKDYNLTIKDASRILGLSPSTLRKLENEGLIKSNRNNRNNYRYYCVEDIHALKLTLLEKTPEAAINQYSNVINLKRTRKSKYKQNTIVFISVSLALLSIVGSTILLKTKLSDISESSNTPTITPSTLSEQDYELKDNDSENSVLGEYATDISIDLKKLNNTEIIDTKQYDSESANMITEALNSNYGLISIGGLPELTIIKIAKFLSEVYMAEDLEVKKKITANQIVINQTGIFDNNVIVNNNLKVNNNVLIEGMAKFEDDTQIEVTSISAFKIKDHSDEITLRIDTLNDYAVLYGDLDIYGSVSIEDGDFSVGSDNEFFVDETGNLIKINNVDYSWPNTQSAMSDYVLINDGNGNLSWGPGGVGSGGAWSESGSYLYTEDISLNVGVGNQTPEYKLDVSGDIRIATGYDLYFGTTPLSSTGVISGSSFIGVDILGLSNTTGLNLQEVLEDLDSAITGSSTGDITEVGDVNTGEAFTLTGTGANLWFHNNGFTGNLSVDNLTSVQSYTLPNSSGEVSLLGQTIDLSTETTGVLSSLYGGTGDNTSATTGVAYVNGGDWQYMSQLGVQQGGTGTNSFVSNGILYGNGTNSVLSTSAGTNGYILYSDNGTPSWLNVSSWDQNSSDDITTFVGLSDVPGDYTDSQGMFVRVNSTPNGLEFYDASLWDQNSGDDLTSATAWSGDLSGSGASPTVSRINGTSLGITTATSGNLLIASGSEWVSRPISGDVTITSLGDLQLGTGVVSSNELNNTTVVPNTYGSANQITQFTVDEDGRITSASNVNISYETPLIFTNGITRNVATIKLGGELTESTRIYDTSYEYIYFDVNTGRLGIGNTSPQYVLDVSGSIRAVDYYSGDGTQGGTSNVSGLEFKDGLYTAGVIAGLLPSGSEGQLLYNNAGVWTSYSDIYWDDQNGHLGIGTTAPSQKLDVQGSILSTGGVYVGANNTNNLLSNTSTGAGSTTLYIGNESILMSGDIGSTVQGYDAQLGDIAGLTPARWKFHSRRRYQLGNRIRKHSKNIIRTGNK
jgi:DNA-binding transcriptional MerR regulator